MPRGMRESPSEISDGEVLPSAARERGGGDDLAPVIGASLRRLRTQRGMSLESLAKISHVSRAMLGQIELGRSTPTITLMWKIARALHVPISTFLGREAVSGPWVSRAASARVLSSTNGTFSARALMPAEFAGRVDFDELRLVGFAEESGERHPPGTLQNLVVARGCVHLQLIDHACMLERSDSILFQADSAHAYRNPLPEEAVMYRVVIRPGSAA